MVSLAPPSRLATFIALAVADVHPIGHMIVTQQRIILGGITTTVASTVTKSSPMNLLGSPKQTFFVGTHQSRNLVEVGQNGNATVRKPGTSLEDLHRHVPHHAYPFTRQQPQERLNHHCHAFPLRYRQIRLRGL